MAKQQLKELKERWQEKRADFQRSDPVAAMNACLLRKVQAERDVVTQLKAAAIGCHRPAPEGQRGS